MEIQELEQNIVAATGKTQAHYQKYLGDLCHAWEALQEDLVGLGEEETARIPLPSAPLLTTSRLEEPATPAGHEMLSLSRSPPPQEMSMAANDAKNMEERSTRLQPP